MSFTPTVVAGEPTWEIARLFPAQGQWTVDDYLDLNTNRLVEYSAGFLEVLPMPTEEHQLIALFLYRAVFAWTQTRDLGTVLVAPFRVKLWEGKFREPDVVFLSAGNQHRRGGQFWDRADLAIEVVSPDDPSRDWETKRVEYAKAGIPEYWIVDPRDKTITVFSLDETAGEYVVAPRHATGETAKSVVLPGLEVDVTETFSQV